MLKRYFTILLAACSLLSCTKKNNTTINNITKIDNALPAFVVLGVQDVTLNNGLSSSVSMPLTIQYLDSAQQRVTLSVSGLPAGVYIDTNWTHVGFPTFNTTLTLWDTASYAPPGNYSILLTATPDSGMQKTFLFNLKVNPLPASLLGKYSNCDVYCSPGTYTDSVYADPSSPNKIWFINFANSGNLVYGIVKNSSVIIPSQTFGTTTYDYSGLVYGHHINISFGTSCAMDMF